MHVMLSFQSYFTVYDSTQKTFENWQAEGESHFEDVFKTILKQTRELN